MNSFSKLD